MRRRPSAGTGFANRRQRGLFSRTAKRMTPEIPFNPPPENLAPANGDIHVFCASLDQPLARMEQLAEMMLSADERRRAARFIF